MPYATANDVSARLGRTLTTDEATQVAALLGDVELTIRGRIPDLDDRAEDETYLATVIKVEANAVKRVVRNPDGYTGETDGNYSYQLNWRLNTGEVELTEKDWAELGISSGVFAFDVRPRTPFERAQAAAEAAGVHPFLLGL